MTLGLTDGTNFAGLTNMVGHELTAVRQAYGRPVSTSPSGSNYSAGNYGITTDPTKSGMVADLTQATAQTIAIIKY